MTHASSEDCLTRTANRRCGNERSTSAVLSRHRVRVKWWVSRWGRCTEAKATPICTYMGVTVHGFQHPRRFLICIYSRTSPSYLQYRRGFPEDKAPKTAPITSFSSSPSSLLHQARHYRLPPPQPAHPPLRLQLHPRPLALF